MSRLLIMLVILVVGAVALSPAIAYLGLDPLPWDIDFHRGNLHIQLPVAYSLCASAFLALLYYVMKR